MEECSLDLIFLKGTARLFVFLVGDGLFFPIDETKFPKIKCKQLFSLTIESVLFITVIRPYTKV